MASSPSRNSSSTASNAWKGVGSRIGKILGQVKYLYLPTQDPRFSGYDRLTKFSRLYLALRTAVLTALFCGGFLFALSEIGGEWRPSNPAEVVSPKRLLYNSGRQLGGAARVKLEEGALHVDEFNAKLEREKSSQSATR